MYDVVLSMAGSMTRTHDYAKRDEENSRIVAASNLYGRYTPPIKRAFAKGLVSLTPCRLANASGV